jgi:fatty acid desaturase
MSGVLPVWSICLLIPILYVRSALSAHELMHICPAKKVSFVHRLMMVLETPIGLGYREYRDIHIRHHRYAATGRDPEYFQIRGPHMRALATAMLAPEWSFVKYARDKGLSRDFVPEAAVRFSLFVLACWLNPVVFFVYWITIRLSAGFSAFMFHHLLHYRQGRYGTYPLHLPRVGDWVFRSLLGASLVNILYEHPAHHAWQQVKVEYLPDLAELVPQSSTG